MKSSDINATINLQTGVKAPRKMLKTFWNAGTAPSYDWEVLGSGVTSSSISFNPITETATDILGITTTDTTGVEMSQDMSPHTVKGGQKLPERLERIIIAQSWGEFSINDVMIVKEYLDFNGGFYAEIHKNSSITPQSQGGESFVDFPLTISFSNDKIIGSATVDTATGKYTFKPYVAETPETP